MEILEHIRRSWVSTMQLRHHGTLAAATLLLCAAAGARADQIGVVTIINATYTATCVGGTCNEVVNGTFQFDLTTDTAFSINLQLTGSLNASLDTFVGLGQGPCTGPGCLQGGFFYDSNFVSGNPIEFSPSLDTIPTSIPLPIDPSDSTLFVPTGCGGDQPTCGQTGTFPAGDHPLSSGTYTAEDPRDEECARFVNSQQAPETQIATIHQLPGARAG